MQTQKIKIVKKYNRRSPRLETIRMVERALYKYSNDKTITEIWKLLPKKVMWTTYTAIIAYIHESGKIWIEKDNTVSWTWDPKTVARIKRQGLIYK